MRRHGMRRQRGRGARAVAALPPSMPTGKPTNADFPSGGFDPAGQHHDAGAACAAGSRRGAAGRPAAPRRAAPRRRRSRRRAGAAKKPPRRKARAPRRFSIAPAAAAPHPSAGGCERLIFSKALAAR